MIVVWSDFVDGSTSRMQLSASRASGKLQGFIPKGSATVHIGNSLEHQKLAREFPSFLGFLLLQKPSKSTDDSSD